MVFVIVTFVHNTRYHILYECVILQLLAYVSIDLIGFVSVIVFMCFESDLG